MQIEDNIGTKNIKGNTPPTPNTHTDTQTFFVSVPIQTHKALQCSYECCDALNPKSGKYLKLSFSNLPNLKGISWRLIFRTNSNMNNVCWWPAALGSAGPCGTEWDGAGRSASRLGERNTPTLHLRVTLPPCCCHCTPLLPLCGRTLTT